MTSLGTRIRELRISKNNMKQGTLAQLLGKHASILSTIEGDKVRPTDEFIVQIIKALDLKRKDAAELINIGSYPTSLLDQLRPDFNHYPKTDPGEIDKQLRGDLGRVPVWHLDRQAVVTQLNLLCAWTWKGLDLAKRTLLVDKLFGYCVFEIYARDENFDRLMPPLTSNDMMYVKPPTYRLMEEDLPESARIAFRERIEASPVLKDNYEHGRLDGKEWKYTLKIQHPYKDREPYLVFEVIVERVMQGDKHEGFLIRAEPVGTYTIDTIQGAYDDVIRIFGKDAFVQRMKEPEPVARAVYPSYYPQLTISDLFYVTSENEAHRLMVQQEEVTGHFFLDLIAFGPLRDLMRPGLADKTLVHAIRVFYMLTRAEQWDRTHPLHQKFLELQQYLYTSPDYDPYHDQFWQLLQPTSYEKELPDGSVLCEPVIVCRYAHNVLIKFQSVLHFPGKEGEEHRLVFMPANTETAFTLILFHLEELYLRPKVVGDTPFDQFLWFLTILRTVKEGITEGVTNTSWTPEQELMAARAELSTFPNPPSVRMKWAMHYVEGEMVSFYNHEKTESKLDLLRICIGFCQKAQATYVVKLLMQPIAYLDDIPTATLSTEEEFTEEVGTHRITNGYAAHHLAEQGELQQPG